VTVQDVLPAALDNNGSDVPEYVGIRLSKERVSAADGEISRIGWRKLLVSAFLILLVVLASRFMHRTAPPQEPKLVPLSTYPGLEYMPSISPDQTQVAFEWTGQNPSDPYGVYVKRIGDERARRLTETPPGASDGDPVWSPDGKQIYFARRGDGQNGIFVVSAEGGTARKAIATSLASRRLRRARFDISPDGKTIVYPDALPGKDTVALFLVDLASSQSRQITWPATNSEGDGDPVFSHDGKLLAFQRDTLDLQQVFVIPGGGGGELHLVTSSASSDFLDGLGWTSDDHEILLGGKQLRRIALGGDDAVVSNIMFLPGPATFPTVRGELLAYVQAAVNANIWKLELRDATHAAGEPAKLISSTRQQAAAAFSPDGSRIAFQSDRSGHWEIWICNRDGSDAVQLTHFGGLLAGTPRWSPDGKMVAFDARVGGLSQIYIVSAQGGEPQRITNSHEGSDVPSWSRDGKWIYYSADLNGLQNVWKVPASGGTPEAITQRGGIYAAESPDARYIYYSRGSHDPAIWRIPVEGGPEEQVKGVPTPFDCSHWVIVSSGIYLVDSNADLLFYRAGNQSTTRILHDQRFVTDWSMAISPDGREVVWAQIDDRSADLMLVEHFR
jgi:Tol biopolymer transport system component